VQIPPERWAHRVPEKYRDRLARRITLPNGGDGTLHEDGTITYGGTSFWAGHTPETFDPTVVHWDEEAGCGSPEQRVREQDTDGVDAEIIFSGGRGIKDRQMLLAVVRAHNEWMAEEFCAFDRDRLLGLAALPHRGVDDDIAEMERGAKLGLRGVILNTYPSGKGHPTPEDDRFWAAALDLDMPVTVHTSMERRQGQRGEFMIEYPVMPEGYDRPPIDIVDRMSRYGTRHCGCLELTQMIMSGVFDRFPKLKIYWAENQLGWIPIYLEQMDMIYEANRFWVERILGLRRLARRPSEYAKEHAYWGFFDDPVGVQLRHRIGVDHIMWGSDFPHEVTRWPNSMEVMDDQLAGVPAEERRKMMCENAVEFFHLDRAARTRMGSTAKDLTQVR
jgi:predicted TIM-barrel fold metal-dependent hydrolase